MATRANDRPDEPRNLGLIVAPFLAADAALAGAGNHMTLAAALGVAACTLALVSQAGRLAHRRSPARPVRTPPDR